MSILWCCCDPIPGTGVPLPPVTTLTTSRLPPQVTRIPDKIIPVGAAIEVDRALPIALPGIVGVQAAVSDDHADNIVAQAPVFQPYWGTWRPDEGGFINIYTGFLDFGVPNGLPIFWGRRLSERWSGFAEQSVYLSQGQVVSYLGLRWRILGGGNFDGFAEIGSAYLYTAPQFQIGMPMTDPTEVKIAKCIVSAADADDTGIGAPSIAALNGYTRTTASVIVQHQSQAVDSDSDGFSNFANPQYSTGQTFEIDVTEIAQEIVDRPGWVYGNRMTFLFDESGSDFNVGTGPLFLDEWGCGAEFRNQDNVGTEIAGPEIIYESP